MFTELFNQLPQQVQVRSNTLGTGIGLDPVFVFFGIVGCLVYIIILLVLVQIHEKIVKRRKNALEAYTFAADTVLYEIQKWIHNNLIDVSNSDWINNRDASENYTSAYEKIQTYAEKISPEASKSVHTTYKIYSAIHRIENFLWYFLIIITIWAYTLFWQN